MAKSAKQNVTEFQWTGERALAAQLLAEDKLTDEKIAAEVGVSRTTLHRWKEVPVFQDRVVDIAADIAKKLKRAGIRRRENRLNNLQDRVDRMYKVIHERGKEEAHKEVKGWKTGLLVHQVKGVGKGEDFQLIDLYAVDTGLLRELREHEKQAAIEVGEWTEKRDSSGTSTVVNIDLTQLTDEQLDKYEQYLLDGKSEQQAFALARTS